MHFFFFFIQLLWNENEFPKTFFLISAIWIFEWIHPRTPNGLKMDVFSIVDLFLFFRLLSRQSHGMESGPLSTKGLCASSRTLWSDFRSVTRIVSISTFSRPRWVSQLIQILSSTTTSCVVLACSLTVSCASARAHRTIQFILYHTGYMVKYCNRAWKKWFFASFFQNILKTAETILIKNNWAKPWHFGLQKWSNKCTSKYYIFRDNNCFVKMSVSLLVCTLPIFVDELAQKLVWISKPNFTRIFGPLRLRAD